MSVIPADELRTTMTSIACGSDPGVPEAIDFARRRKTLRLPSGRVDQHIGRLVPRAINDLAEQETEWLGGRGRDEVVAHLAKHGLSDEKLVRPGPVRTGRCDRDHRAFWLRRPQDGPGVGLRTLAEGKLSRPAFGKLWLAWGDGLRVRIVATTTQQRSEHPPGLLVAPVHATCPAKAEVRIATPQHRAEPTIKALRPLPSQVSFAAK